ncbi:MAG: DUF3267 domain-containing protein [Spiribacter salinus]|uniref:DUF3267 domain-containing protein n=1 Tax=Spiribacter salinus TaxID=1335746 RepID=A0A540V1G7_9GAMM|nr:MAG: DUF3267 domain-containing protein [Spiribacter salinus]
MDVDDRSFSSWKAQALGVLFMAAIIVVAPASYLAVWGSDALDQALSGIHPGVLIGCFVGGILVHEALHGLGWVVAGQRSWERVSFGFQVKSLTPYAHIEGPMQAWAYRIGAALPGVVLGLVPWVLSIALGHTSMHIFGIVFTAVAAGDAMILWTLRDVPATHYVQDHPHRVGCLVLGTSPDVDVSL